MSMFDELRCEYPLPDGFSALGVWFQSKDTPEQDFERYILRATGELVVAETGAHIPFHGTLTFYTTNISGSGPQGVITSDDTPPYWAEYCALYDHGRLLTLEGSRKPEIEHPWITRETFYGATVKATDTP